jgi:AAA family ATP:ADP antiporter
MSQIRTGKTLSIPQLIGFSGLGFLVLVSYGLARPSVETAFNVSYGKEGLPWVWIAVAFAAVVTVMSYNRFAARVGLLKLFLWASGISMALLVGLLLLHRSQAPGADFLLYVWKDVYIVVLVEIFWTYANANFSPKSARWIYGLFLLVGSMGSVVGLKLSKHLSSSHSNEHVLLAILPCLVAVWLLALVLRAWLGDMDRESSTNGDEPETSFWSGLKIIQNNQYLFLLVALIATIQVVVNLIDYEFNAFLNNEYACSVCGNPVGDARTAAASQIYEWVEYCSLGLQALTGIILTTIGIGGTLLLVPIVLCLSVAAFAAVPIFATMAAAKVSSKCMDYSIFRAAKEILYIPLSYKEKTEGKAVVDILCYRVAKIGASMLLLALGAISATSGVIWCVLGLIGIWIALTFKLVPMYKARSLSTEEGPDSSAP